MKMEKNKTENERGTFKNNLKYMILVDIARYQSNFSEYEGKSLKKE